MLNYSPASENNKIPILKKLAKVFENTSSVLEIGSGSGQHAIYFAEHLRQLIWQPSELENEYQALCMNIEKLAPENVKQPLNLDVCRHPWPVTSCGAVYTANTLHIMAWENADCFFKGASQVLDDKGLVCIYGPFKYHNQFTTASNAQFDSWLKQQRPESGIRDFENVSQLARHAGLNFVEDFAMPANNQLLVFEKH